MNILVLIDVRGLKTSKICLDFHYTQIVFKYPQKYL